jgi:hypothetical protein
VPKFGRPIGSVEVRPTGSTKQSAQVQPKVPKSDQPEEPKQDRPFAKFHRPPVMLCLYSFVKGQKLYGEKTQKQTH